MDLMNMLVTGQYLQKNGSGGEGGGGVSSWHDLTDKPPIPSSYNDLTDRPCYEKEWTETKFNSTLTSRSTAATSGDFAGLYPTSTSYNQSFYITDRHIHILVCDGIWYRLTELEYAKVTPEKYPHAPFFIDGNDHGKSLIYFRKPGEVHEVQILYIQSTSVKKQLDEKFIPSTIARTVDIPSLSGYATEKHVQDELNKALTNITFSWDDLTGKPFGYVPSQRTISFELTDEIIENGIWLGSLVKVTDELFSKEDFDKALIYLTLDGETTQYDILDVEVIEGGVFVNTQAYGPTILCINEEASSAFNMAVGTYFQAGSQGYVSSLVIEGTVFQKIGEEYLPEVPDSEFIEWLNETNVVAPVTSASGDIYVDEANNIYVL